MAKFNHGATKPAVTSPVVTARQPSGSTHEGAPGYARDVRSELFLLAVTNMVGEQTFYEKASTRDNRYTALIHQAATLDPVWTANLLRWLRGDANMRSAALVGAAEFVHARLTPGVEPVTDPTATNRAVINSVLQRADEPGELLAYWTSQHGRALPKPVKRGISDAVGRLYTERNLLKYDTDSKGYRFGDVIDLVHPAPVADWQGDLFAHALDRRHGRDNEIPPSLQVLIRNTALRAAAAEDPGVLLHAPVLKDAGMTWEDVLSIAGSKVDKAKLWEALIPSMGYMACLRNLRNFDEAGVSDAVAATVAARLSDPEQVARSRQLPMRFLSAYRAAPSLRWAYPLEQALSHCLANLPAMPGRTLIMVDTSGSMHASFSKDGTLMRWDAAVLFGVALAQRCAQAEVVSFSNGTAVFPVQQGESLLKALERWRTAGFFFGGGTATAAAVQRHFANHDRVVVLTDEQAGYGYGGDVNTVVPQGTPMVTFNLAGYQYGHAPSGTGNRVTVGGLTDQAFRMIPLLESGRSGSWPWADQG